MAASPTTAKLEQTLNQWGILPVLLHVIVALPCLPCPDSPFIRFSASHILFRFL